MIRSIQLLTLAAVTALAPALAACGSSSQPDATKFLDNEKIERAIEASILQQRHKTAAAQCPALELKKKGLQFICIALTPDGAKTTFRVTEVDSNGHVEYVGIRVVGGKAGSKGTSGTGTATKKK